MPRKGPPKTTRREERDKERQKAAGERLRNEQKTERAQKALRDFQTHKREMPETRGTQRDLRRGLAGKGLTLERYGDSESQRQARGIVMEQSDAGRGVPRGFTYEDIYGAEDEEYDSSS
ncbi:hypothetical protein H310_01197 [Aphanomyces invadans]|uniref:Uncharacterized protein n=1 Tax=Aphanomyces invadans TaxID=157072 RepID=A0A024UQD9_9STRA|nr:hypothetical protein H310_01197 [Aphanomyces invadans]ETW08666.1 hypothetical protein H310_01197 [Aphanomyces invadans]RHY27558.1 hypothetical protein DYB32_006701 [Aphanomyces invadans]|eukprot:XP_008862471.1 hypothetical protein H310_01197 [Aphanomyces invadans]